jgi:hypothetical protein
MKFLEMVFRLSRLVLEIAIGGHDILLVGVVRFLVVIIAAGCDCDPPRAPLLPLLASLSTFLHAFADGSRWRCLATAGDHLPVAQNKGVPIQHPPLPEVCQVAISSSSWWCSADHGRVHAPRYDTLCQTRLLR